MNPSKSEHRNLYYYILFTSILMEAAGLYLLAKNYPEFNIRIISEITGCHFAAAVLCALSLFTHNDLEIKRIYLFAYTMILTIPVFGFAGIILFINKTKYEKSEDIFEDFHKQILEGLEISPAYAPTMKKSFKYLKESFEIEPLKSTIELADVKRKLAIIKSLGKIHDQSIIRTIKSLLNDPHMDVRYYAGEELARFSERFSTLINQVKKEIELRPDDYALHCELGSLYMRHALSGILEEGSENEELEHSRRSLEKSLSLNNNQFEAKFLLGRLFLFQNQFEKAILLLREANQIKDDDIPTLLTIAECLWYKEDIAALGQIINRIEKLIDKYNGEDKSDITEFLNNWRIENANKTNQ